MEYGLLKKNSYNKNFIFLKTTIFVFIFSLCFESFAKLSEISARIVKIGAFGDLLLGGVGISTTSYGWGGGAVERPPRVTYNRASVF